MVTRAKSVARIETFGDNAHVISWTGLLDGDDGDPVEMPGSADRSIQCEGEFGSGGSIQLEGSNDGVNWHVLTDPQGNDIVMTEAGLEAVTEITRYARPRVTAGDGTTDLSAYLLVRRP